MILLFYPVNINFCRQKSATKFLCVKTSSGNVVATSFLSLKVHKWIAGDVPIHLKFSLEVTQPVGKRRFRQISLNSAAESQRKKVQILLIGSRQRAFHRAIDEPCALPLSPLKGGSKREFLHLALPFISLLQVIVDILNLICGLNIASQVPAYR